MQTKSEQRLNDQLAMNGKGLELNNGFEDWSFEDRGFESSGFVIGQAEFKAPTLANGLYIVSTPIGNLGDITIRALQTLAGVAGIACEDTRVTRKLLQRYAITTPVFSYHEHNAQQAGQKILELMQNGKSVALVSDAGTPLISDPGYRLVNLVRDHGLAVFPVPGASATLAAMAASGLATDRYSFFGFLPHKSGQRKGVLQKLINEPATLIFFESPNRIAATLADMVEVFGGDRQACVCRELTKLYEEFTRGDLALLAQSFKERNTKGEIVIVVAGAKEVESMDAETLLKELLSEMSVSRAANEAAKLTGQTKRDLYQLALRLAQEAKKA